MCGSAFVFVDYRKWGELAPLFYLACVGALVFVLMHGLKVHGSRSWIDLGPFNAQPSEFMKLVTVLLAARLLASRRPEQSRWGTAALLDRRDPAVFPDFQA